MRKTVTEIDWFRTRKVRASGECASTIILSMTEVKKFPLARPAKVPNPPSIIGRAFKLARR